ncbi:WD40 repeat-like protein [Exidia glandulosa HHB12029]|uniref:WD40 repeat-like protein n=1 Tax=Exidia glandulosa HHB12029 TaxID=1314781 RepID=A0A165DED8_EXIGL|nr:WD40 repeat-like protein [Exidia glandulosa HHB12029]
MFHGAWISLPSSFHLLETMPKFKKSFKAVRGLFTRRSTTPAPEQSTASDLEDAKDHPHDPAMLKPVVNIEHRTGSDAADEPIPPPATSPVAEAQKTFDDAHRLGRRKSEVVQVAQPALNAGAEAVDVWSELVDKVRVFSRLVEDVGDIHPYAKMATTILLSVTKPILAQDSRDKATQELLDEMKHVYDLATAAGQLSDLDKHRRDLLKSLSLQTVECASFIREQYGQKRFWARAGKNAILGYGVDAKITNYSKAFRDLRGRFTDRAVLATEIRVVVSLSDISEMIELQSLTHVRGAGWNKTKACLSGTRTKTLDALSDWINDPEASRVRFLIGASGTGKSSIAHSIGLRFEALGRLGSFFAFDRNFQRDRNPESVFSTLAHNLAQWNADFKHELAAVIREKGWLAQSPDISSQWDHLVVEPANKVVFLGPVLVVFDAFDECGPLNDRSRKLLLQHLAKNVAQLPPNFRVLVTTRSEDDVMRELKARTPDSPFDYVDLNDNRDEATSDIERYISHELSDIADDDDDEGLPLAQIQAFAVKAEGLFMWAATACRALQDRPAGTTLRERFDSRFAAILSGGPYSLDDLYAGILSEHFLDAEDVAMSRFRSVMAQIISAAEPLSVDALIAIHRCARGRDGSGSSSSEAVALVLRHMGALLSGVKDRSTVIQPLHTSFRDFLVAEDRSGRWHIPPNAGHDLMAIGTLRVMNKDLVFNICRLASSYTRNDKVPGLRARLRSLPPGLIYCARHWGHHISHAVDGLPELRKALRQFMNERVLFWLEIVSLCDFMNVAAAILQSANDLIKDDTEATAYLRDLVLFVRNFNETMTVSAPHIYISALAFTPTSSLVRQRFVTERVSLPVIPQLKATWPLAQDVHLLFVDWVLSMAKSPDGRHIVAGSRQGGIRIVDAESIRKPVLFMAGMKGPVWSVAYSPDGRTIVSGCGNSNLRRWDAQTGEAIGPPMRGHSGPVYSVAFTPDGRYIISGSGDRTVCRWDALSGEAVGEPLRGHSNEVRCVACSPRGQHIISASLDSTVRFWDAVTGAPDGPPLRNPWGRGVFSLSPSPSGHLLAVGVIHQDARILLWDTDKRAVTGNPLRGHSQDVTSISWSSDGRRLVSASNDMSVRVWDVQTREAIGEPLFGHTGGVTGVTFSHDGQLVLSGACDCMLRVWNLAAIHEERNTRSNQVQSIAFSPDGRLVAARFGGSPEVQFWSCETGDPVAERERERDSSWNPDDVWRVWNHSADRKYAAVQHDADYSSIQLIDVEARRNVAHPLRGHRDTVHAFAFSPNGHTLASGSADTTIRLWDITDAGDPKPSGDVLKGHTNAVIALAFFSDGRRLLSGSWDSTMRIWDVESCQQLGVPFQAHPTGVTCIAISPAGDYIVSGGYDTTVRVWQLDGTQASSPIIERQPIMNLAIAEETAAPLQLQMHDGWIFDEKSNLIVNVPDEYRAALWWPRLRFILGRTPVVIDFRDARYGTRWEECWTGRD